MTLYKSMTEGEQKSLGCRQRIGETWELVATELGVLFIQVGRECEGTKRLCQLGTWDGVG